MAQLLYDHAYEIVTFAKIKNLTFGFAESCTGGLLSSVITDVPGSSKVFEGSFISYSNNFKENILGVSKQVLDDYSEISLEVAKEMAFCARTKLGVDIALSLTGLAGPGGGSEKKPVGTLFVGLSSKEFSFEKSFTFQGDREDLKKQFAFAGLNLLKELLQK